MSHPKYTGCIQLETRQSKPQVTNIQQITNRRWENTAPSGLWNTDPSIAEFLKRTV